MSVLSDLFRGKHAHADPLTVVEDIDWQQAGMVPDGFTHSIYQLAYHLNFWMDAELKCIETGTANLPEDWSVSWPTDAAPRDEVAWRHEVALFRTNLDQLMTLADAKASTLARIAHHDIGVTVEAVLCLLVAHNSYHVGQMVQVRQALGAWPPG